MQQLVLAGSVSVAANSSSTNVLTGSKLFPAPTDGSFKVELQSSGGAPGEVTAKFTIGTEDILDDVALGSDNRLPENDKDVFIRSAYIRAGKNPILIFSNTTAGALNGIYKITFTPRRLRVQS